MSSNINIKLNPNNPREKKVIDFLKEKGATKYIFLESMDVYMKMYHQMFSPNAPIDAPPIEEPKTENNEGINFLRG